MNEENELAKLEGFVSTLLEKFNGLQNNNKKLAERLQRRDASIMSLEDEIASMQDERGEISSRVSGLINKIEEWESATIDGETSVDEEAVGNVNVNAETTPVPESESEAEVEDVKKDSSVQGNLFSVEATGE